MKKYLSAVLALMVIAGIYGCGDNKTKEKLLGTAVYSGSTGGPSDSTSGTSAKAADSASSAVYAAQMAVAMSDMAGPTAPGRRSSKRVPGGELPTYNSGTGYFSFSAGGMDMQFRFLNASGQPVAPSDGSSIMTVDMNAVAKINMRMSGSGMSLNMTMDVATGPSDPLNGQITITVNGMTSTCTMTNLIASVDGTITSGQIRVTSGGWVVALTFNNGSASGTIAGPGYSATITLDENGNGTYIDAEGTHTI